MEDLFGEGTGFELFFGGVYERETGRDFRNWLTQIPGLVIPDCVLPPGPFPLGSAHADRTVHVPVIEFDALKAIPKPPDPLPWLFLAYYDSVTKAAQVLIRLSRAKTITHPPSSITGGRHVPIAYL